jgi:hypothetical protein
VLPASVSAQDDINTYCEPDQAPVFAFGFADLKAFVGDAMGDPTTCQYGDPDGSGDIFQQTTTGTAIWRAATSFTIFSIDDQHWALTSIGPVAWSGPDIDPSADLLASLQAPPPPPPDESAQQPITAAAAVPSPPLGASIYWGAYISGVPASTGQLDAFESIAGKKVSIVHWGQSWGDPPSNAFQTSRFDTVRNRGSIPMINWGSWQLGDAGVDQPDFRLATIASGKYDGYIQQWAQAARDWGHPFFLRFDQEMNGYWQFPWAVQANGNQPADYVAAWRHVHDVFVQQGAINATWVWCPNVSTPRTVPLEQVYPGDDYVDWTCFDGYNWGTDQGSSWQSFAQVFGGPAFGGSNDHNSYQEMLALAPTKPIMIGEFASSEHGGSKSAWITDMLQTLPTTFPRIKAIVWVDWNIGDPALSWPIESSADAQSAFANGIASPVYASNQFGNLPTGAIPELTGSATGPTIPNPIAVTPVADTYTSRAAPTSTRPGSSVTLRADAVGTDTAFLLFDLSSLGGKTINSVTLRLHSSSDSFAGSAAPLVVRLVASTDWKEGYMTFKNPVQVSDTVLGTTANSVAQANTSYDISLSPSLVQRRAGGLIAMAINTQKPDVFVFNSRESGAAAPQLVVGYS